VTGLGREHPVENGFAWHHILGTPYLPGSSIKGLLRAWARDWEEDEHRKAQMHEILGQQESRTDKAASVGATIVFDAIPAGPVKLEVDVMTPHYDDYYQKGFAPGDWISPKPIPFLVVPAETIFQFAFAPRRPEYHGSAKIVEQWLRDALQWLGAGAKTAVGYGRFAEVSPRKTVDEPAERAQHRAPEKQPARTPNLPSPNDTVDAILLKEKTKKGGWKAKHIATGISGPIQNTGDVPSDAQPGITLSLIVASAKPNEIAFRYPTDSEMQRAERSKQKSRPKKPRPR
jgi:CRISPR type III-B/RAMP module RAMP protein Cmr6